MACARAPGPPASVRVVAPGTTRYAVLLRGINVGRARQVDMTRLRELLTDRGYGDVRTHLRSGNVVLDAEPTRTAGRRRRGGARSGFGMEVPVVVRTGAELAAVVAGDPCPRPARTPATTWSPSCPPRPRPTGSPRCRRAEGEGYRVIGRELYQWLPGGIAHPLGSWKWEQLLARRHRAELEHRPQDRELAR